MNATRVIISLLAVLAMIAAPAHAQDVRLDHFQHGFDVGLDESMIVGLTACTTPRWGQTQTCLPIETTDQLFGKWAGAGPDNHLVNGVMVRGVYVQFTFFKFHPLRRSLYYASGSVGGVMTDAGLVISYTAMPTYDPERNAPDCVGGPMVITMPDGSLRATDDAPQAYVDACGFKRYSEATPETAAPEESAPAPEATSTKVASCAPINVSKKRVAVTSTGLRCSTARTVLARYMRIGKEPSGWVCSRLAVGKSRSASCGTPGRAAKRIVGRWRM